MDLTQFEVDKDYIMKVHDNCAYNNLIIEYYRRYYNENGKTNTLLTKINSLSNCNKFWLIDRYDYSQIKDYKRTNLCRDKFCNNCKKVKQATRMSKYIPELEIYKDNLFHLTLTVPNVVGKDLRETLTKMAKAFRRLIYCFRDNYVSFIDFKEYGYKGAVRSLEITFNGDSYHPHYHCAFVFDNLVLDKNIKNNYSIDFKNNRGDKLFSEFEIKVQKIWRMIYDDIPLNKNNYDKLDIGYSCNCDKFRDSDYAELFKYMTKSTNESDNLLTYENFVILYRGTYLVKQIQGYGCLYRISDKDLDDEVDKVYDDILSFLLTQEEPEEVNESLLDLLNDNHYKLISRKKIYTYLRELD